jgi:hypothetical protein
MTTNDTMLISDRMSLDVFAVCRILLDLLQYAGTLDTSYDQITNYLRGVVTIEYPAQIDSYRTIDTIRQLLLDLHGNNEPSFSWSPTSTSTLLDVMTLFQTHRPSHRTNQSRNEPRLWSTFQMLDATDAFPSQILADALSIPRNRRKHKFNLHVRENPVLIEVFRNDGIGGLGVGLTDITDHRRDWWTRLQSLCRQSDPLVVPPVKTVSLFSSGSQSYVCIVRSYIPEHYRPLHDLSTSSYNSTTLRRLIHAIVSSLSSSFWDLPNTGHHDLHPGNILVWNDGSEFKVAFIDFIVGTAFLSHPVHEDYGYNARQYTNKVETIDRTVSDVFAMGQILLDLLDQTTDPSSAYCVRIRKLAYTIRMLSPEKQMSVQAFTEAIYGLDPTKNMLMGTIGSNHIPISPLTGLLSNLDLMSLRMTSRGMKHTIPPATDVLDFPVSLKFVLGLIKRQHHIQRAEDKTLVIEHLLFYFNTQQYSDEQTMRLANNIQTLQKALRGTYLDCIIKKCTIRMGIWITPRYRYSGAPDPRYASTYVRRVYRDADRIGPHSCDLYIQTKPSYQSFHDLTIRIE